MAINIERLKKAASRFEDYSDAIKKAEAEPELLQKEREVVAERHRKDFRPAADRLLGKVPERMVVVADALSAVVIETPPVPGAPATVETVVVKEPLLVSVNGGLVPEIIQRDNDLRPMRFMHIGLMVADAVGRIRISDNPNIEGGDATGFMVAPGLLMTNWHVLKNEDIAAAGTVVFDDEDGIDGEPMETKSFRLRPDVLYVSDETLDYAIVAVTPRTTSGIELEQFGFLRLYKQTGKLDPTQRQAANIVQHPGGGPKKIALRDNYVWDIVPDSVDPGRKETSLFYGTDTLKGSSGSPVCSDQWYVVALHRGGVPGSAVIDGQRVFLRSDHKTPALATDSENMLWYVANEGTRVSRIYNSLEKKADAGDVDARVALERISAVAQDPKYGPISRRTTPILLPSRPVGEEGGAEEITRRKIDRFTGNGYEPDFLNGFRIGLPGMASEVVHELAPLKNSTDGEPKNELKYSNYSLMMNRERRTAFYAAANIDGSLLWKQQETVKMPNRPEWSFDPRMDEAFQPDDDIFSSAMQRGHLFKREDAVWGADHDQRILADLQSFTITNATPMIANFNNVEWGDLEDIVTREAGAGNRITYFAGPIFRSTDRFFNELKAGIPPEKRKMGMRVPESFWKIVAWVEDGKLNAAGFILDQTDEIAKQGPITVEIDFKKYKQKPVGDIEQATGLRFPELKAVDTFVLDNN